MLLPSTARMRSPLWRCAAAGEPATTSPTVSSSSLAPKASAKSSTKAISRFTAGPAAIVTIRFQTGWR